MYEGRVNKRFVLAVEIILERQLNGRFITKLDGYTSSYIRVGLDEEAQSVLKVGSNCLAVHCTQTTGGQYIDVGLVDVIEQPDK